MLTKQRLKQLKADKTILFIDHVAFRAGDRAAGDWSGMGGRRFEFQRHGCREIEVTHDLWCLGEVPPHLRKYCPNNADFRGGAKVDRDKSGRVVSFTSSVVIQSFNLKVVV